MNYKQNIELEVASTLSQDPFEVIIGNKKVLFNKLSLSDRERISAYSSLLPTIDEIDDRDDILYDAIACGKYAKTLAKIIAIASNPKSNWLLFRSFHIDYKKRRIYKLLMNEKMSIMELHGIYSKIAAQIGPAFFLDIIISLKGSNHLKPTKEIGQIVHGQ